MVNSAREKLLDNFNFSPSGIYPKSVVIDDWYSSSGDLKEVFRLGKNEIFFVGSFNVKNPQTQPFLSSEIDSLYNWSLRGGKIIIASGQKMGSSYDSNFLNYKWGYSWWFQSNTDIFPTVDGLKTDIFSGPFGNVTKAAQGGAAQGYFDVFPINSVILGVDAVDNVTMYMDCKTLDLVIADVDAFTEVGVISKGYAIVNDNERLWGNTIAFMDKLQSPPLITKNNKNLSVDTGYTSYQWYLNGHPIQHAKGPTYTALQSGKYEVETGVNGGCKVKTSVQIDTTLFVPGVVIGTDTSRTPPPNPPIKCGVFVPTAFSPEGNGVNDLFCVYGNCIKEMHFKIYDRWGELVFESDRLSTCWDGTYKGMPCDEAVFAWTLTGKYNSGNFFTQKGNLSLIR